jgi:Flp pilus assembly protein TadG
MSRKGYDRMFELIKIAKKVFCKKFDPENPGIFNAGGSVLVEFALAIPVFVAIIYYMHDLPKLAHVKKRMEFVAHEMVNILQNISQGRDNKKITLNDIRYAVSATYLSFYPGLTQYTTSPNTNIFGHARHGHVVCVKGLANGNADILWRVRFHGAENSPSPLTLTASEGTWGSSIYQPSSANIAPSVIYPSLQIREGEIKILVECGFHYHAVRDYWRYYFTNGRYCADVSDTSAFGFLILQNLPGDGTKNDGTYFNSVVIFKPKSGLFSEIIPQ